MYLRHTTLRKDGKVHRYWRLVRSVRVGRKVIQQTVAHLGELDPEGRARAKALARAITGDREQSDLFEPGVAEEAIPVRLKRIRLERGRRLPHKRTLEQHLVARLGELFALDYDLLLYDVTSTYFEGQAEGNPLAQRGYSRDHRPDCKQVCLALVVTRDGMPLGYEVFAGNRTDVTTVEEIVEAMEARYGVAQRIWVMDRGMTSEDNLEWLRESGRGYLVGTPKTELRKWARQIADARDWHAVRDGVRLAWTARPEWDDWARWSEGCYVLRTNVADWTPEDLWRTYIQLTDAEAAFRIQKSELGLRPIWHQRADRVEAHILVCFLAYVLWKTLEQWQQRAGLGHSPRTVLEELRRIQSTDVVLPTEDGREIRLRCVVRPDAAQAALLDRLGLELPERLRIRRPLLEPAQM